MLRLLELGTDKLADALLPSSRGFPCMERKASSDVWLNQAPTLGRRVFIIDPQLLNLCLWTAGCYTPGLDALEDLI